MRRESVIRRWIACAAVVLAGATGCTMLESEDVVAGIGGDSSTNGKAPSMEIMPQSVGEEAAALPPYAVGRLSTRSLIDGETTVAMKANFLRLDEDIAVDDSGLYTYTAAEIPLEEPSASPYYKSVNWSESYLLEATLMSSPNKDHIRSVYLDPVQTYKIRVYTDEFNNTDTLDFYHTRMVGWYPLNCGTGAGNAPICKFGEMFGDKVSTSIDANGNGVVAVQFTGLDGQTDLMVSDMIEGQHWHSPDATPDQTHYHSNYAPAGHPTLAEGTKIYSSPFGSFSQQRIINSDGETTQWAIDYDNHFTYHHYLSAVRIFARAERSPQNLAMWGDIENVLIANQPTSVKVSLPYEMGKKGEAFDWADEKNLDIATGPIFGEGDTNSDLTEEVHFPVSFSSTDGSDELYLGYALVCPNRDVEIMLHTTSGMYNVVVQNEVLGANVFEAGHIYDIHLNLRTNGTIAALLEEEEEKIYYDLTRLTIFEDAGGSGQDLAIYRYANSYVVSPDHTPEYDADGNMVFEADGVTPHYIQYDGYCFDASVIGNGQPGIISSGTQTLYPSDANIEPKSARLLWESERGLVTNVELLFGYVRFRVPDHSSRGNAVIAVYDADGTVLWSWHIWITDPPAEKTFENGDSDIILLDRNLGATLAGTPSSGNEALQTYGLYYQWGRKDPSMGPNSFDYSRTDLISAPYYDYSSRERTAAEVVQLARPTTRDGVENPMFLILPTAQQQAYYYNWIYERNDILWGHYPDDGTTLKTIYDPCPYGYRVPTHGEMSIVFEDAATSRNTYGQVIGSGDDANFFPYAGYKGVDRDLQSLVLSWNYVGKKGDYMTSTISKDNTKTFAGHPVLDHRGRVYLTSENRWEETTNYNYTTTDTESKYRVLDYANRRTAASVRCVKNNAVGAIKAQITPSQGWYVPGSQIEIVCDGIAAESSIVWAKLVVKNVDKGTSKTLYTTPDGHTESLQPTWSHEEIFIVGVMDGEFWSQSYEFELTVMNGYGVTYTTTATIANHNHTLDIDLSAWEAADVAEAAAGTLTNKNTYTREFVVTTSGASDRPASVTVSYTDDDTAHTKAATFESTNGANHTYSVEYSIADVGAKTFTVSVVCDEYAGHTVTKTLNTSFDERVLGEVQYYWRPKASKWYYWNGEDVVFEWWSTSPNGNITDVEIIYDYNTGITGAGSTDANYPAGTVIYTENPGVAATGSREYTFSADFAKADKDGYLQSRFKVEDEFGKTGQQDHACYIIYTDYEGWNGKKDPNTDFEVAVIVSGGTWPHRGVTAEIDGNTVTFTEDYSHVDTRGRYDESRWVATLNLPVGTYDGELTLWFNDEQSLEEQTPTLKVADVEPLDVSLTTSSDTYLFYGAKSEGIIKASASSPNGNLVSVVIKDEDDNIIYENYAVGAAEWGLENVAAEDDFVGGEGKTYTITATDEYDVTATATIDIATVYRVTQKTSASFTAGGTYLIENQSYDDTYLNDGGTAVAATGTLTPNAFITFSGTGTSQTFRFISSGNYASGGDSNGEGVSANATAATSATTYTLNWSNNRFRIYHTVTSGRNTYTYYWEQTSDTNVQVRRNNNNDRNWNIYEVTTN